ncbi:Uncharacterised protein [Klebsiella pneumoniae]|nr:Uncharacterised protein [Klebsiella pneumoniae]
MWTRTYAIWPQQVASLQSQPSPFCEASRVDAFHGSLLTENGEQHDDTQRTVGYPEIWQVAPAGAGPDLYGRHLQSAICLDAVDKTPGRQTWRRSARIAGHLLAADHPADLLFPFSGTVSGKIWPAAADRYWHGDGGNELGAFRAGEWPGNALAGLWLHGRPRDRDRLHRRCRPDGQMVPTAAGICRRRGGGGLRDGGHHNHLPHLPVADH